MMQGIVSFTWRTVRLLSMQPLMTLENVLLADVGQFDIVFLTTMHSENYEWFICRK